MVPLGAVEATGVMGCDTEAKCALRDAYVAALAGGAGRLGVFNRDSSHFCHPRFRLCLCFLWTWHFQWTECSLVSLVILKIGGFKISSNCKYFSEAKLHLVGETSQISYTLCSYKKLPLLLKATQKFHLTFSSIIVDLLTVVI